MSAWGPNLGALSSSANSVLMCILLTSAATLLSEQGHLDRYQGSGCHFRGQFHPQHTFKWNLLFFCSNGVLPEIIWKPISYD